MEKGNPKIIHLTNDVKRDLTKLAADEGKDLKNFIQDYLTSLVRGKKNKISSDVK